MDRHNSKLHQASLKSCEYDVDQVAFTFTLIVGTDSKLEQIATGSIATRS